MINISEGDLLVWDPSRSTFLPVCDDAWDQ